MIQTVRTCVTLTSRGRILGHVPVVQVPFPREHGWWRREARRQSRLGHFRRRPGFHEGGVVQRQSGGRQVHIQAVRRRHHRSYTRDERGTSTSWQTCFV